jgi:MFS family permease
MYSVSILSKLLPTRSALLTVIISAVNLLVTVACAPLADRIGRKPCLLLSIAGMGANALLLAVALLLSVPVLAAVAALLFVVSFAVGLGPVPFILSTELVGADAVGAVQSCALAANWLATFAVAQFFPLLNNAIGGGNGGVYFVFAGIAAASFVFVLWRVPESRGKQNADEVWGRTPPRRRSD